MTKKLLINLTNHPYNHWSEEQTRAALIYGECIDLPFPSIDATGGEDYVSKLASEYLEKIRLLAEGKEVAIHLMGEMTFSFALVSLLLREGVRCIASTTERITKELPDGHKEVEFRFSRFRDYKLM